MADENPKNSGKPIGTALPSQPIQRPASGAADPKATATPRLIIEGTELRQPRKNSE